MNDGSFKFIKGYLNDLWMFNITSQMWTWVSGNNTANAVGVYGTKGVSSANNYPGSRYGHSMVLHPSLNCLFVFGGEGYATSATLGMFSVIGLESFSKDDWMISGCTTSAVMLGRGCLVVIPSILLVTTGPRE